MKRSIIKVGVLKLDYDSRINMLVVALLAYYPILYTINVITSIYLATVSSVDSIIVAGLLTVAVLIALRVIISRTRMPFFIILLFFMIAFILGLLGSDEQAQIVRGSIGTFFGTVLPYFAVGMAVRDYKTLRKDLRKVTPIIVVAITLWIFIVYDVRSGRWQNNMGVSYCFLPWALLAVDNFLSEKKALNAVWLIVSALDIFLLGTRGPLLLLALFVVISLLRYSNSRKIIPVLFLIIIVAAYVYINFYNIILWLDETMRSKDIIIAGLQKVLYAKDISNGRNSLTEIVWRRILENPFAGWGIFRDRASDFVGTYVHSLPLELMLNYGIFFGPILLIFCIYKPIMALVKSKATPGKFSIIFVLLFVTVGKLMMSGSYLEEPLLYLMLGMTFSEVPKMLYDEQPAENNNSKPK